MARKTYIVDTSVFIHDPNCVLVFKENDVIVPIAVLEELDKLKSRNDGVGSNARIAIRKIDEYCEGKNISEGVVLDNDVKLIIDVINTKDERFNAGGKDDSILASAISNKDSILKIGRAHV